jgi:hypothetical protein
MSEVTAKHVAPLPPEEPSQREASLPDVVVQLRALHVSVGGLAVPEVDRICEAGAREIERLRTGLHEIASMSECPFNRQSVRAREVYLGHEDELQRIFEKTIIKGSKDE